MSIAGYEELSRAYEQLESENAKLREELYVPGVHVCPKCKFRLVSNTLYLGSGTIGADRSPKECLNGCGNMWRVSERDERKEAQKTAGDLFVENKKLSEENARLKAPMKPVAWLAQFKYDKIHNQTFFTNDQKVRMPAEYASGYDWLPLYYPAPPAFLIAEAEASGRKEALLEAADVFDKQSNRELFCGTVADEIRNMAGLIKV